MRNIDLDAERAYENKKVSGAEARATQSKYYWATSLEAERHLESIKKQVSGRIVLEIGCSSGSLASKISPLADQYIGTDISDKAIELASQKGLRNSRFLCCDGHSVPLEGETVDVVIVDALLHHMDLERALREIARLLRPGGILFFNEPLGTNPLFQLYRRLTPQSRTVDERPFTRMDLRTLRSFFEIQEFRWFGFTNIASAFARNVRVRMILTRIDRMIALTPLRLFFWQFSGSAVKK